MRYIWQQELTVDQTKQNLDATLNQDYMELLTLDYAIINFEGHTYTHPIFVSRLNLFGPRSTFILFHPSLPATRSLLLETRALHYLRNRICFKFPHQLFKQKIRTERCGCVYLVHKNFYTTIFILATQVCSPTLNFVYASRKLLQIWILNMNSEWVGIRELYFRRINYFWFQVEFDMIYQDKNIIYFRWNVGWENIFQSLTFPETNSMLGFSRHNWHNDLIV